MSRCRWVLPGACASSEDEPSDQEWLDAATQGGAFDFLNAPEEDRYTLRDGKPFDDAR